MSDQSSSTTLIIPFMRPIYDGLADYAYPLLRVTAGAIFIRHGYAKLFGGLEGTTKFFTNLGLEPAGALVVYVGSVEFFGGILLILGLLTRPVAALAAINLFVAMFLVHWGNGFFWNKGGIEFPLMWGLVMIVIFIRGGHTLSIDRQLKREF